MSGIIYYRRKKGAPPRLDGKLLPETWTELDPRVATPRMKRELSERRYCEFRKTLPKKKGRKGEK